MTLTDDLQREDAGMERAAVALCWAERPVLMAPESIDRISWWQIQSDVDRRKYLYRVRVVVEEWEAHHGS